MPTIPSAINGVTVVFGNTVNKSVDQKIIDGLKKVIKPHIATGYALIKIYISSANDQHESPSRHVMGSGKAVDISRINSLKLSVNYPTNATVKAIVDAIQTEYENYTHRRENFGTHFKKKLGNDHTVSGHGDHIHLSVN